MYSKRFYNISDSPIKLRDAGKNPTAEKGKFTILGFSSYFLFRSLSHAEPVEHERIFFLYQTKRKICCSRASNNNHKKWFHDAERIKLNSSVEKRKKKKKKERKRLQRPFFRCSLIVFLFFSSARILLYSCVCVLFAVKTKFWLYIASSLIITLGNV